MERSFANFSSSEMQGATMRAGTASVQGSPSDTLGADLLRSLQPNGQAADAGHGQGHPEHDSLHDEDAQRPLGSAAPVTTMSSTATSLRLFVSKLPNSCTPRRLREYFEMLMEAKGVPHAMASSAILDVYIPAGPSGRLRNFSFVSFSERGFLELVLRSGLGPDGTHVLDGRRIYLDVAAPRGIRVHNGVVIGEDAPMDARMMQPAMGAPMAMQQQGYAGGGASGFPSGPADGFPGSAGMYGDTRQAHPSRMQQQPMQYGYQQDYGMPSYAYPGAPYPGGPPAPLPRTPMGGTMGGGGGGYGPPQRAYGGPPHPHDPSAQYRQPQVYAPYGYTPQPTGRFFSGSPAVQSTRASGDRSSSQGATSMGAPGTGTPALGQDREAGQGGTVGLTGLAMSRPFDPRLPTLAVNMSTGQGHLGGAAGSAGSQGGYHAALGQNPSAGTKDSHW